MRLDGKIAVITGGSSGIGRAITKLFAESGAIVNVFDVRENSRLEDEKGTIQEIIACAGEGQFYLVDVTKQTEVETAINEILSVHNRIDILVNNAGIFVRNNIIDVTNSEWDLVQDVNIKSYLYLLRAVIPQMVKQNYGKIINLSSIHGLVGTSGAATYCASKGAIINLTKQLAVDYSKNGINVNCISPGTIITAQSKPFREQPALLEEYHRRTMLDFLGMPEDVAYAALYLASDRSRFVQGHNLVIDGGWTSW
ncbi:MAG: SDR family NAD(P)-dependent oxidoreductase [Saccharofermentanales bacterium]|jgi:NAD(P)-dependent dehydrogenase (short-subunit alcohol dehydrogenase family)|nr:SDR family oxidoreductase [Bacteroidales bacterium]